MVCRIRQSITGYFVVNDSEKDLNEVKGIYNNTIINKKRRANCSPSIYYKLIKISYPNLGIV